MYELQKLFFGAEFALLFLFEPSQAATSDIQRRMKAVPSSIWRYKFDLVLKGE
ncbi:hypothetical protein AAZV13_18G223100 [Glycine max]